MTSFRLLVTEGLLERPVAMKLLSELGLPTRDVVWVPKHGRQAFWRDAKRYNRAAQHAGPILGLADLETRPCPSGLIAEHLPDGRHLGFVLRIAERMLESWLLADSRNLADFLGVSPRVVPRDPEAEVHAKRTLVNIARSSPDRGVRSDLVPEEGSKGTIGRGYTPRMTEFVERRWHPLVAARRSQSLRRAIAAIKKASG
jgi:hypothetical protein